MSKDKASKYSGMVPLYVPKNVAVLSLVKSILDGEGIRYLVENENVQSLIGLGAFGTGFNPLTGPIQVYVEKDRVEVAKILLEDLLKEDENADE
jgi:hypothetical protein